MKHIFSTTRSMTHRRYFFVVRDAPADGRRSIPYWHVTLQGGYNGKIDFVSYPAYHHPIKKYAGFNIYKHAPHHTESGCWEIDLMLYTQREKNIWGHSPFSARLATKSTFYLLMQQRWWQLIGDFWQTSSSQLDETNG